MANSVAASSSRIKDPDEKELRPSFPQRRESVRGLAIERDRDRQLDAAPRVRDAHDRDAHARPLSVPFTRTAPTLRTPTVLRLTVPR
ncbi:MAG: hypothetical protein H6708_05130 [Kofleriaceae bacterium]|nr:hypothetical protein [Myxococcales bacterium]MCB9559771.1 hypothetical protein [Kofleriaceae bacterium]